MRKFWEIPSPAYADNVERPKKNTRHAANPFCIHIPEIMTFRSRRCLQKTVNVLHEKQRAGGYRRGKSHDKRLTHPVRKAGSNPNIFLRYNIFATTSGQVVDSSA